MHNTQSSFKVVFSIFILATVIDKKVIITKTSFLALKVEDIY